MTTIAQERAALGRVPGAPAMRRREQWGARFNYTTSRPVEEPATRVFVHITVTNPRNYSSNDVHARAIENIGITRFPSTGISYNRLIMPDGALYEAQPIGRRGAHTVNDFRRSVCTTSGCPSRGQALTAPSWNLNVNARAYVICQNVGDPVSDKQVDTIARAIAADKLAGFVTKNAPIHGHRCVSSKSCPGDRMWARMGEVNQKVNRYVANGLPDSGGVTAPLEDWFDMATKQELAEVIDARLNNVLVKHSEGLPGADGKPKNLAWVLRRLVVLLDAPLTMPDGRTTNPRTLWKWSREDAGRAVLLLLAQEPLLAAAAQGRSLSATEVQQIAGAISAVIPANIVEDLADEIGGRLVAGRTGPNDE